MLKTHTLAFVNGLLIGSLTYLLCTLVFLRTSSIRPAEVIAVLIMSGLIGLVTLHYQGWEEDHNLTLALSLHFASILIIVGITALYNGWISFTWQELLPFVGAVLIIYILVWQGMIWHRRLDVAAPNHLIQKRRQKSN